MITWKWIFIKANFKNIIILVNRLEFNITTFEQT